MNNTFLSLCKTAFFTPNFHLLHQVLKDVENLENLNIPRAWTFSWYDVQIKNAYQCISQKRQSRMEQAVKVLKNSQPYEELCVGWRKTGEGQRAMQNANWVMWSKNFLIQYEIKRTTIWELPNVVRAIIMGKWESIAMDIVIVYQKDTLGTVLWLLRRMNGEQGRKSW